MPAQPKIEQVETFLVDLPTIRPHQLAMTTMSSQTLMIVRIRCSDGIVGIGEGTTIGGLAYGAESPEGMKLAIDTYFAPHLLKSNPNQVGATMAAIGRAVQDNRFAKCAVETALLDALGKRAGLSVSDLLGGRFHDRLPVAWTLASGNTAGDIAEAEAMLAKRRHNVFKLKIGKAIPKPTSPMWHRSSGLWAIAPACALTSIRLGASRQRPTPSQRWKTSVAIWSSSPLHCPTEQVWRGSRCEREFRSWQMNRCAALKRRSILLPTPPPMCLRSRSCNRVDCSLPPVLPLSRMLQALGFMVARCWRLRLARLLARNCFRRFRISSGARNCSARFC